MKFNTQNVALTISAGQVKQFPRDLPQIAFSGRSNVGKSSLINLLLNRKSLARVSGEPGKTITINFYCVDKQCYFVDLPGYGYAKRDATSSAKWQNLTDSYFRANDAVHLLKTVIQLVDAKVGLTRDDEMMVDYMNQTGVPYIIVATKTDKLNQTQKAQRKEYFASHPLLRPDTPVIFVSSLKKEGKDEVIAQILRVLSSD